MKALEYAMMMCDTVMNEYDAPDLPQKGRFHYIQGVFLSGMEKVYIETGDEKYYNYIKEWIDSNIIEDGSIRFHYRDKLDDLQAARLLFMLYDKTGTAHYKKVLDNFIGYLERWDFTPQGGFWHMHNKPNQMWLDGLYMAGSLLAPYAARYGRHDLFDLIYRQIKIMFENMRDEKTGLLYHAWDCSRKAEWADKETGLSEEFWGRAIGWVALSLVDMLDFFPEDYHGYKAVCGYLTGLLESVVKYQNLENGLWYQVVDKGSVCGNWTETSCSALFTYSIAKAVRRGYLGKNYADYAICGYDGIIKSLYLENNRVYMPSICAGTGVGNYDHYISRPRGINDLHGVGAFVMMCCEMEKLLIETEE